ncbi:MAG: TM2 domain-containing protein [Verrucomicrobiales bacterium]|nr:TM2 domain-containing protein [Verrucomicrobiales bacterium]
MSEDAPQQPPPQQEAPQPAPAPGGTSNNKMAAGICGILLGSLGVHKFILGYTKEAVILLCITVLTCGFGAMVTSIIGLIEGIIYLTKTDEEFEAIYVQGQKPWF